VKKITYDKELNHTYSHNIQNKKIVIFGPYPPPLGGVAIHVRRVIKKLRRQNNIVSVFDTTARHRWRFWIYLAKLFCFIFCKRPDSVYYHTIYLENSLPELQFLFFLRKIFRFDVVLIEHDCCHLYIRDDTFKKAMQCFLHQAKQVVFIGDTTYESYLHNRLTAPCFSVESAFLPPDLSRESEIIKTYPKKIFEFIDTAQPLIVANAFQLTIVEGKDLYGFDMCIHLLHYLKKQYPQIKLVFALAKIGDQTYFQTLCSMIEQKKLKKQVFFLTGQKELWPLLKYADLFVRPTLSDSFGISVAEALLLGIPAVASDVCIRQKGTVLFETGNQKDFFSKVEDVLGFSYQKQIINQLNSKKTFR